MDIKENSMTREEEAKLRTQKFNERIKNNLKENFDKYKMKLLSKTPITTDTEV